MRRYSLIVAVTCLVLAIVLSGCQQKVEVLRLATTTSTYDSGLLDYLLPIFEQQANVRVEVVAKGTGEALALGQRGDVDVVLVHAREAEDQFVAEGYGVDRRDVMYNDFVILGPQSDPAGIGGGDDALVALRSIASADAVFVSRGDNSGTHKKEASLWQAAAVTDKGQGYREAGIGMADALRMAHQMEGYILADRATYLALKDTLSLAILVEGDSLLFNPYGIIAVNPARHKHAKHDFALQMIEFMTSPQGQELIGEFGLEEYGQPLFYPDYDPNR